jgi:type IV pilus assembly protein PilM
VFSSDRILALNIGASKILLAEFSVKSGNPPELVNYGFSEVNSDPEKDASVGSYLADSVRQVMKSSGIRPAPLMLCLSGQMVFPRFVRLPAVGQDKLLQMVQYEVEQNVPFPLEEIVWNHQFLGDTSSGEQSAMIVAAKIENIREITDAVSGIGLEPEIVDVAPMALYNCLRYNMPDLDGCTVLLDIGARSTNLIFVEGDKIYSRCIPVAGNAITQELAKGFEISFAEAEKMKRESGFVSMGGVSEVPDPTKERMSKIIRNVVTRLHAEISRSINFYRSQQGGSLPTRIVLTGGSSVLPRLNTFFEEKLHVEVKYLNPFANVAVGPKINAETLSKDAFVLSETVGLALRRTLSCPIEINLMPPELVKRKSFRKRIPFFGIAAAGVLLSLGIWTAYEKQMASLLQTQNEKITSKLDALKADKSKLDKVAGIRGELLRKADEQAQLMSQRTVWLKRIDAVRRSLLDGMWITELSPTTVKNEKTGDERPGLHIVGWGWSDKMAALEEKAKGAGHALPAVDQLAAQLRLQPVFGNGPDDIKIRGVKDVMAGEIEFTLDAAFASAPAAEKKDKSAR